MCCSPFIEDPAHPAPGERFEGSKRDDAEQGKPGDRSRQEPGLDFRFQDIIGSAEPLGANSVQKPYFRQHFSCLARC